MKLPFFKFAMLTFLGSPGNAVYDEILRSGGGWRGQRRSAKSLVPAYSIYTSEFGAIEDPPAPPQPPIPTDVPVKEPIDVPLGPEAPVAPPTKEPHDTPPEEPKARLLP